MTDLIEQLLQHPDPARFLRQTTALWQEPEMADALAATLKQQADHHIRHDLDRARQLADLALALAQLSQNPLHEALGRRALGNVLMIGVGLSQAAIAEYEQAAAIYASHNQYLAAAQSRVGVIGALYLLGRYEEAIAIGRSLQSIFTNQQQWPALTGLLLNLANIHRRLGQGQQALALLDEARDICADTGATQELPGIEINRANVFCDLGDLPTALQASQHAEQLFQQRGQNIGVAQARMSQGVTRFLLGQYNEALALFDRVREMYVADGRSSDAVLVERYVSDLFLQVGRFADVLQKSQQIRQLYAQFGITHEVAHALINEAIAYAGLRQYNDALNSLAEARSLMDNPVGIAEADLEKASILYWRKEFEACRDTAVACATIFADHHQPFKTAQAQLIAARAAFALGDAPAAEALTHQAMAGADLPWLRYQCEHLLGQTAEVVRSTASPETSAVSIDHYTRAIEQLEQLRGRLMVEFRADFLADKNRVYEDVVALCLAQNEPDRALHFVERTKSRALVDLLAHRLDLRIQPRASEDGQLVAGLQNLRQQRNQLLRRWEAETEVDGETRTRLSALEQQISHSWHKLLVRNADYARDAALLTVRTEPIQPYLDDETLLLEYFLVHDELVVFLVTHTAVTVRHLPQTYRQLAIPSRFLQVNMKAAALGSTTNLLAGAQKQLQQLHQLLIAPIQAEIAPFRQLVIVPHTAVLHYLPFHALYDGDHYLIEQHEISYLPAASLLHYQQRPSTTGDIITFGYSCDGRLPHAPQEAEAVARLLNGRAHTEQSATLHQLQQSARHAQLLHLATHGDFNQDNPLFSGLTLADGQLNTLDIFHLRLTASLVTLSACQTGRSVISGGDELLGLMRAFLYAGSASLLLSLWRVSDESTLHFMMSFYEHLAAGKSKVAALRLAQQQFSQTSSALAHPYYWAPFFLVGATGSL